MLGCLCDPWSWGCEVSLASNPHYPCGPVCLRALGTPFTATLSDGLVPGGKELRSLYPAEAN